MFEERKRFFKKHKTRLITVFIAVFCITCLELCAEEMTAAKAKVCRENLVAEAKKYIGCSYSFGAIGPDSFDCSGLVYYVAKEANGTQLPRTAKALYSYARIVPDTKKEPGDLLFFKTTSSGNITHVGIYIGNNQFISALSDGPNNGVILSSLNESYWKSKYMGAGQIYKSGKLVEEETTEEPIAENEESESDYNAIANSESKSKQKEKLSESLPNDLLFDASVFGGWSLLRPNSFMINFRGVDLQVTARYNALPLSPGIGLAFRYNAGLNVFQIPILLSITPIEYLKVYIGPVFTIGTPRMNGDNKIISQPILPGIIGVSAITPSVLRGKVKLQFVQDLSYSICSTKDGAALGFVDAITAGLVFYTGVKVTFPLSVFIK